MSRDELLSGSLVQHSYIILWVDRKAYDEQAPHTAKTMDAPGMALILQLPCFLMNGSGTLMAIHDDHVLTIADPAKPRSSRILWRCGAGLI